MQTALPANLQAKLNAAKAAKNHGKTMGPGHASITRGITGAKSKKTTTGKMRRNSRKNSKSSRSSRSSRKNSRSRSRRH